MPITGSSTAKQEEKQEVRGTPPLWEKEVIQTKYKEIH